MADISQLEAALIKADAAGNSDDAMVLAAEIRRLRSAPQEPAIEASPEAPLGQTERQSVQDYVKKSMGLKDYAYRGTVLPFGENADGSKEFAWPKLAVGLMESFALPQHAAKGGAYTPEDALQLASLISPVSTASRAGETVIPGAQTTHTPVKPKVPTAKELKTAASAGYDSAAASGVEYSSKAAKGMVDDIAATLNAEGRIAELNPELFALLKKLQMPPSDSTVGLQSLSAFRKRLGDIAGSTDPAKAAAATIAIKKLDGFLEAADPQSIVARAAPATGTTLPTTIGNDFAAADSAFSQAAAEKAARDLVAARGNSAAAFRSDRLSGLEDTAELRAAAANSGRNIGNTIRQRLTSLITSHNGGRGFSPEEITAIEQVIKGTASENALRYVGNLLGGGGGAGQTLIGSLGAGGGAAVGGMPGAVIGAAIPGVAGAVAKSASNNMTKRSLQAVDSAVRSRSPLYQSRLANRQMEVNVPAARAALLRQLAIEAERNNTPRGGLLDD